MDSARVWRFLESYPRLAGLCPAVGYTLVAAVVGVFVPLAGFALALAAALFAFGVLFLLRDEQETDPDRDFGELPTYPEDGLMAEFVFTVDPEANGARRTAITRAIRAFLFALLACCIALALGVGHFSATGGVAFG